ncbi:MAG: lipopolysaccharide transport periplasmic protein LptA [Congregibacter sp.]
MFPKTKASVPLFVALLTLATLSVGPAAYALPDDSRKAIEITAARALRDEKAGYTVYSGDVVLAQGSLYIEADKLTIFHDREAADRIVAIGNPARLRQRPELDKGFVTAMAKRIVYEKSTERVMLRANASIEQDGAVVSGESIDYFMAEQRVFADADADDAGARVQVLIPAETLEAQDSESESESEVDPQQSDRESDRESNRESNRESGQQSGEQSDTGRASIEAAASLQKPLQHLLREQGPQTS